MATLGCTVITSRPHSVFVQVQPQAMCKQVFMLAHTLVLGLAYLMMQVWGIRT